MLVILEETLLLLLLLLLLLAVDVVERAGELSRCGLDDEGHRGRKSSQFMNVLLRGGSS